MLEEKDLAILNYNNYLRSHMNNFLEAFVMFYGEDCRKELEEKFKNVFLAGYQTPDETMLFIDGLEKEYTKKFISEELKKVNLEEYHQILFSDYSFERKEFMAINTFKKYYDLYLLGEEKRKQIFIEKGLNNLKVVKPDATLEEYNEYFKKGVIPHELFVGHSRYLYSNAQYFLNKENIDKEYIESKNRFIETFAQDLSEEEKENFFESEKFIKYKKAYDCYMNALEKYNQLASFLKPYKENILEDEKIKNKLKEKYEKKYILASSFLLTDKELEEMNNYLNRTGYMRTPKCIDALQNISDLLSLNKESQEKLDNNNTDKWQRESIIRNRIRYFNNRGIDLGSDYKAYCESEDAKKVWPSYDDIDKIINIGETLKQEFYKEYYPNTKKHQETREEISKMGFLDEDSFDGDLYSSKDAITNPNIIKRESGIESYPLIFAHISNKDDYLDHKIVHELNHVYEMILDVKNDSEILYIFGWDFATTDLKEKSNESKDEIEFRKYELFNEIINELISQEISKLMINNGLSVFNDSASAKYKGNTSYEDTFILINEFYHEFFKEILESRRNKNMNIIFNRVGKENFDELNSLFKIFNEHFSGINYQKLGYYLANNIENEATITYNNLIARKNEILENMRNYSKNMAI